MSKSHRLLSAFFIVIILFSFAGNPSVTAAGEQDGSEKIPLSRARAYYIKNVDTGIVLKSSDQDEKLPPASTVKMMSGLILCEKFAGKLDEVVTITAEMAKDNNAYRSIGLAEGQKPTVRDLLYLSVCGSYNDAVKSLAIAGYSTPEALVSEMNARAAAIGMTSTHYENYTGIDNPNQYTTLRDIAILAAEAAGNALFKMMAGEKEYSPEGLKSSYGFSNYNKLIATSQYRNTACVGLNAGNTPEAGYYVTALFEKDGLSYLAIVCGAEYVDNRAYSYVIANELINWALNSFSYRAILKQSDIICEIPVSMSITEKTVLAVPERDIYSYIPKSYSFGKELSKTYILNSETLAAPVKEGDEVGFVTVFCNGEKIGETVRLVAKTSAEKSEILSVIEKIKDFSKKDFFKGALFTAGALTVVILVSVSVIRARNERKKRAAPRRSARRK